METIHFKEVKMKKLLLVGVLVLGFGLSLITTGYAGESKKKPVEVVVMTTPFGTNMYSVGAAFEQVFKKAGSWVHIKHQETPGAIYMFNYVIKNREKMIAGKISHTMIVSGVSVLDFLAEGRWPFKTKWPQIRMIVSTNALTGIFISRNPKVKTMKDLKGKRVGVAEMSRPFVGSLMDVPLFEKGLGIIDDVDWAPLGSIGTKDAFLNGKIDARNSGFGGKIKIADDGTYYFDKVTPDPATMEILNSGRKLSFLSVDRELIEKSYDFSKDPIVTPILIKKGAFKGLDRDIWGRGSLMGLQCDSGMPDDVVEEIIRVRHKYKDNFAKYHASLAGFPDTPYPLGTPEKYVHKGVVPAMKKLGLPIPKKK